MAEEVEPKWKIVGIHPEDSFFGQDKWKYFGFHRSVIKIENQTDSYLGFPFIYANVYFEPGNDENGEPYPPEFADFIFAAVLLEEI